MWSESVPAWLSACHFRLLQRKSISILCVT